MKAKYMRPTSTVNRIQMRGTLLAGTDTTIPVNPGNPGGNQEEAEARQLTISSVWED